MSTLERAIELAVQYHKGQRDKAGEPYILHPLRVMLRCQGAEAQMVAVMHDLLEDTPVTPEMLLQEGFSAKVLGALEGVTRRSGESYQQFVQRAKTDPVARQVKLADLEDNMDVRRLKRVTPRDAERLQRYRESWQALQ
ncbi:HD domain-containing protein [bacterium]|nr:HD domain-containing protein [bacterium]